jgi:hypothetical protein
MSHEFGSLAEASMHFAKLQVDALAEVQSGLRKAAKVVENEAKRSIGEYQEAIGPFPAWEPLSDATEAEKARKGYPVDAPLLRTGEMRDSIEHELDGLEAVIGSMDDKLLYQELGTAAIPPRPVLGPAVLRKMDTVQRVLGTALMSGLISGDRLPEALGYEQHIEDK